MKLINTSNHPSTCWSDEQKRGWDEIVDIPFPIIKSEASEDDVMEIALDLTEKIFNKMAEVDSNNVMLQGDFSACFLTYQLLVKYGNNINFCFPTTERIVEEVGGKKISIFKFNRWRSFSKLYLKKIIR